MQTRIYAKVQLRSTLGEQAGRIHIRRRCHSREIIYAHRTYPATTINQINRAIPSEKSEQNDGGEHELQTLLKLD